MLTLLRCRVGDDDSDAAGDDDDGSDADVDVSDIDGDCDGRQPVLSRTGKSCFETVCARSWLNLAASLYSRKARWRLVDTLNVAMARRLRNAPAAAPTDSFSIGWCLRSTLLDVCVPLYARGAHD